jgi:DNA-binding LacI/PurR family transcriptional regulator
MNSNPPEKSATIYDVAALAGVSHITVSRVVNGKQNVSTQTRERVQKAMEELGYVPNPIAKALQTRRSKTIELVTTSVWGSNGAMQSAIIAVAQSFNYHLMVRPTTPGELFDTLRAIPSRMVAGTILYAVETTLDYAALQQIARSHPLVCMGGNPTNGMPTVTYDQYQSTVAAIKHLIDLGHRHIAMITGLLTLWDGKVRLDAYLDTLREYGLSPGPIVYGDFGGESGAESMLSLLNQRAEHPFTAVFASSDSMAVSAMATLWRAGLNVPQDISVIGYDNDPYAQYLCPPLTTVVNYGGELARLTAEYLFELITEPETTPRHQRIISAELIQRESVRRV